MSRFWLVLAASSLLVVIFASLFGWGVASTASVRAASVRQGSPHGRYFFGGGPSFGK